MFFAVNAEYADAGCVHFARQCMRIMFIFIQQLPPVCLCLLSNDQKATITLVTLSAYLIAG